MLQGSLTRLRTIDQEDAHCYYTWINNPELAKLILGSNTPVSKAQVPEIFEASSQSLSHLLFTIEILSEKKPIGFCFIKNIHPIHRFAELEQFFIGENRYRQNGHGRDALQILLQYAFRELNLNRIWLITYDYNREAVKFYEKFGFIQEGILRQLQFSEDQYHDGIMMALIKEDWKKSLINRP